MQNSESSDMTPNCRSTARESNRVVPSLEVQVKYEAELIELLIRALVGDVPVFIVGIELEMLPSRKPA